MRYKGILIIVLFLLLLSGCGIDSVTSGQADMEKALFVSYAGSKTGEDLNAVMIGDLEDVILFDVASIVESYYTEHLDELEDLLYAGGGTVDLEDIGAPDGMSGSITFTLVNVSLTLSLNNYTPDTRTYLTYSGSIEADGVVTDISGFDFSKITVNTPSLEITYTGKSFTTCAYSNWTFYRDNSDDYPDYAFTGSFAVDENTYSFTGFAYTIPSSSSLSITGTVGFDGVSYTISGSLSCDTSGTWTSGDMTITTSDESVNISLSGTTASFSGTMGDWTKEGWQEDRLAP